MSAKEMTRTEHAPAVPRNMLYISLIIIIGGLYFLLSYNSVFFAPDEGASVYHFEKVAEGAIQHRDFYSVYGAAYYLLGKTLFEVFGFKLIVVRKFVLLVKLVIAVLIYCIGIRVMRPSFAFLGALGFVIWWGDPYIATPTLIYPAQIGQALGLLSLLFFFMSLEKNRLRYVLLAGIAGGLNCLFKPNVGLFNMLALHFFVFEREMLCNLGACTQGAGENGTPSRRSLGKIGIVMEIVGIVVAATILLRLFAKFRFDFATFAYALLPFYLVIVYLLFLGARSLRARDREGIIRENNRHAIRSHFLLATGFVGWQLAQVAYFAANGALHDFYRMLTTATGYYSFYALPLWQGAAIAIITGGALLITITLGIVTKRASNWKTPSKSLLVAGAVLLLSILPISWYLTLDNPSWVHFLVRAILMSFSVLICLYLSVKHVPASGEDSVLPNLPTLSLITIFSALILLDAFPKVDPGHIVMVMPPFFVLFGFLAQRFYDFWKDLWGMAHPRVGKRVSVALTCMVVLGIFLPSFFMMAAFYVLLVPPHEGIGWRLYNGRLTPVPAYPAGIERAEGIAVRTFAFGDKYYRPLVDPETVDLFNLAKRVATITHKQDNLFSTMSSALMLYFLADRDSVSDTANCYVWQTAMRTTTSEEITDFSDNRLTGIIDRKRPAAIVIKKGGAETRLFRTNWPLTWSFIMSHYSPAEQIGSFQIYLPKK